MPTRLRRNGQTFYLGHGAGTGLQQGSLRFRSQADARSFLSGFIGDPFSMAQIRSLLASEAPMSRLSDHQVVDLLAGRLVSGNLRLVTHGPAIQWGGGGGASSGAGSASPADDSAESAPPLAPAPAPPPPEPRDEENVDAATQAATLKAAARLGVPFCEQCEKERRERESRSLAA